METNSTLSEAPMVDNVINLPATSRMPDWIADIAEHRRMVRQYKVIAKERKKIATRLRELDQTANFAAQADRSLRHLPAGARARMGLRVALGKLTGKNREAPRPLNLLQGELIFLVKALKTKRAEIEKLETRILTAQPSDQAEAKILLKFVSKLVAVGRKFDQRYLSDLLDDCATMIATPANMDGKSVATR